MPLSVGDFFRENEALRSGSDEERNAVHEKIEERSRIEESAKMLTRDMELYKGFPENVWNGRIGLYKEDFERTLVQYSEFLRSASGFHKDLDK